MRCLDAEETLGRIAELHGVDALILLFYLQGAVFNDADVDAYHGIGERIVKFVAQLPSATEWMKHIRTEGHIESRKSPDNAVPCHVQESVKWALNRLREHEAALYGVWLARGHGHILALELKDREDGIRHVLARLDQFRDMAAKHGVDAEAFIQSMGGVPDLERFGYRT
jgi:hypothetical protein